MAAPIDTRTRCDKIESVFSLTYMNGGAYVFGPQIKLSGFNANLGIGSDTSRIELDVIYDDCEITSSPSSVMVGKSVIFNCSTGFSFCGIIESFTYNENIGGFNYKLVIIDPRKLLSNVTLILKSYYCRAVDKSGNTPNNLLNVAYAIEGQSVAKCPPTARYQDMPSINDCGKFGTSGVGVQGPQNGVSIVDILDALINYNATIYTSQNDPLQLDLSALRALVNANAFWAKIDSDDIKLSELIQNAADAAACDYLVTLEKDGKVKVWLIDRNVEVPPNTIPGIIESFKVDGITTQSSYGIAEVNEFSNKVLVGDNIHYLSEVSNPEVTIDGNGKGVWQAAGGAQANSKISMMLGYTSDGKVVRADRKFKQVKIDIRSINNIIEAANINFVPFALQDDFAIDEREILFAGSQTLWLYYGTFPDQFNSANSLAKYVCERIKFKFNNEAYIKALDYLFGEAKADEWKAAQQQIQTLPDSLAAAETFVVFERIHAWFQNFIDTYYGKKWLVPVKKFCVYPSVNIVRQAAQAAGVQDFPEGIKAGDGGFFYLSDAPTEAGYPSKSQLTSDIKGLKFGQDTSLFQTDEGKMAGFVRVPAKQPFRFRVSGKQDCPFMVSYKDLSPGSFLGLKTKVNNVDTDFYYVKMSSDGQVFDNEQTGKQEVLITTASMIPMIPDFCEDEPLDTCINRLLTIGLRSMAAIFGLEKFHNRGDDKGFTSVAGSNTLALAKLAGCFDCVVVPMKSSLYNYGRSDGLNFFGTKSVVGSTDFEIDKNLNPWNYGSYGLMELVGEARCLLGLRQFNTQETGSMTLAEPPGQSLTYFLSNYNIMLSNITMTYDQSGAKTTYNFQSVTPKFGQFGPALGEQLQLINKNRLEVAKFQNQQRVNSLNLVAGLKKSIIDAKSKILGDMPLTEQKTPFVMFVGGYYDNTQSNNSSSSSPTTPTNIASSNSLTCSEICNPPTGGPTTPSDGAATLPARHFVGLEKIENVEISFTGDQYRDRVIMSMDGLLAPVSLLGRPRSSDNKFTSTPYATSWDKYSSRNKTRPSMPPISNVLKINQKYMNPMVSTTILKDWDGRGVSDKSFNIQFISHSSEVSDIISDTKKDAATDFGFYSLRGPLVLQSWGYDTEGKPIPNAVDDPSKAEKGIFENNGTKNKFMTNWLGNPRTWPVGPIDLRFDRDRGMWVCPPSDRIIVAQLLATLAPYTCVDAVLLNPSASSYTFYDDYKIWGSDGEDLGSNLKLNKIKVCDFLGRNLCAGTKIYAAYVDNKYIVIESSAATQKKCDTEECVCSTSTSTTTTTTTQEPCTQDVCGFGDCFKEAGLLDGVLGLVNGCITLYETTECPTTGGGGDVDGDGICDCTVDGGGAGAGGGGA